MQYNITKHQSHKPGGNQKSCITTVEMQYRQIAWAILTKICFV